MKKGILFSLVAVLLLLPLVLTACSGGGISKADYDKATADLAAAQASLTKAQSDLAAAQSDKTAAQSALLSAQAQVTDLQKQVADLQSKYEFAGMTTEQKVAQIVANYHETHTYSVTDLFVCSDMASEVWNLLKTQGINAKMTVGAITGPALTDISQCTHAWVLAEVSPGQYLALETTLGTTVTEAQNPRYYRGWTFTSPADIKTYQQTVVKYNEDVSFYNYLVSEDNRIIGLYNNSSSQAEADQWLAVHNELQSLIAQKNTDLTTLFAQLNSLATVLN